VPRDSEPQLEDRVRSAKLPGQLGTIIDHQPAERCYPARWLVQPERGGELARWLTRPEFKLAPLPRPLT